jgi:hypothetical protein
MKCLGVDLVEPDPLSSVHCQYPFRGVTPIALDKVGVHKASFHIESLNCVQNDSDQNGCLKSSLLRLVLIFGRMEFFR